MSAFGQGSYNGLAWGPGTQFAVSAVEGLDDLPGLRTDDVARPLLDGDFTGVDRAGGRSVVLTLGLRGADPDDLGKLVAACRTAFASRDDPLPATFRDGTETIFAKSRRRALPYDAETLARLGACIIELYAPDPRVYGPAQIVSTGLAGASGGFGFPMAFPFGFGATGQSGGTVILTNDGGATGFPTITIAAGASSLPTPVVEHVGYGLMILDTTLIAGDSLVIDTLERTIILNGQVSRRPALRVGSIWPSLPPGGATYRFGAGASNASALMTVSGRAARL
jgi:Phage tail protein